jgi:hypothetical protein
MASATPALVQQLEPKGFFIATIIATDVPATLAVTAAPDGQPAGADLQLGPTESRTQHANRVNREIAVISSAILAMFVLCRILLLWQRTHNRKKLVQVNQTPPETKA